VLQHTQDRIAEIVPESSLSQRPPLALRLATPTAWDIPVRAKRCRGGGIVMKFNRSRTMHWQSFDLLKFYLFVFSHWATIDSNTI
jgi:hypothetical protein